MRLDATSAPGIDATRSDLDITNPAAWLSARPRHDSSGVTAHYGTVCRYLARRVELRHVEDMAADTLLVAWRRRADLPDACSRGC